eukprot:CCRYP_011830-RA/>CCRYP_011830-RA protein AED:0.41 eAED:0.41 QI:0/0/0/1/0/0/3/0/271
MIAYHADTNAILVRPFPSKHDAHRIAAYRDIHFCLSNVNRKPMVHILDNEAMGPSHSSCRTNAEPPPRHAVTLHSLLGKTSSGRSTLMPHQWDRQGVVYSFIAMPLHVAPGIITAMKGSKFLNKESQAVAITDAIKFTHHYLPSPDLTTEDKIIAAQQQLRLATKSPTVQLQAIYKLRDIFRHYATIVPNPDTTPPRVQALPPSRQALSPRVPTPPRHETPVQAQLPQTSLGKRYQVAPSSVPNLWRHNPSLPTHVHVYKQLMPHSMYLQP